MKDATPQWNLDYAPLHLGLRASPYEKSQQYRCFCASTTLCSLPTTPQWNLDYASLHLGLRASPYEKSQQYRCFCASTTHLYNCLFSHCSLPALTLPTLTVLALIVLVFHIFHILHYHQGDLKCNRILKYAKIQTGALLKLV